MASEPTRLGLVTVRAYPVTVHTTQQRAVRLPARVGHYLDAEGARIAVEHDPAGLRLRATTDRHLGAVGNYSVAADGEIHLGAPVIDALDASVGDQLVVAYGEPGAWVTLRPTRPDDTGTVVGGAP